MSTLKFCPQCDNTLQPEPDKDQTTLFYACPTCDHKEVADSNIVYTKRILPASGEPSNDLQDIYADPTLPRTKSTRCAKCGHSETVFFEATAKGEEHMRLFFVCCNRTCNHRWRG